jgi:hypothetical protein
VIFISVQLKENGEKGEEETADPDCATLSKKFSFFEHYEEEKGKTVEHKVGKKNQNDDLSYRQQEICCFDSTVAYTVFSIYYQQ